MPGRIDLGGKVDIEGLACTNNILVCVRNRPVDRILRSRGQRHAVQSTISPMKGFQYPLMVDLSAIAEVQA